MIYVNKVSASDINQVIELIKNDKYVIDNLPKNLVKYTKWEDLLDDSIIIQALGFLVPYSYTGRSIMTH